MENSWRRDSESTWQQSATTSFAASASHDQNLFSHADQHFPSQRPQKHMLVTHGIIQEDVLPHMRGSNNMVSADLGTSYLSLLSGPSAQLPHDLQHLSNQKPMPISSQVSLNQRTASGFSAVSRVPLLPGALYPQNMGYQNGRFGEIVLQLTSSSSTDGVNHGNSSMQLQDANLNFRKLQTVGRQNSHGNEKQKGFSSLFGSNNAGAIAHSSWKVQDYSEITTLQRDSNGINFSARNHGHNPASYLPHVFCSGNSGKLLLTDTGLLGVVCSCHGLYMSIYKFLEHSGSYDDNPGNAVYMNTGETLAHWCKTFFSKTGIRVLEGHQIWDWPEGISAGSGLVNYPISSVSNNTVLLNQVGPTRTPVSCGQKPCIVMNSKENHSCSNIVDGFLCHEKEKTLQECSNSLFKDFIGSSRGNLHHATDQQIKGMSNSVGHKNIEKSSQSTRTKVNSTCESSNVLFPLPDIQNLQALRNVFSDSRNPNSLMEGLGISSNIELRLGQPTEPSQTLKTKGSPAFGSILDGVSVESQKLFMDHLPQKSSKFEALQATLQFADIASGSCEGRGTTQSEYPNHVGGAFGAITDYPTSSFSHVMEMTDQNPLLLSCFRNPESREHLTTTNYIGNANHVGQKMHCEDASKSDQLCFPWSEATSIGSKISNAQNHVDKEKEVESTVNGLFGATKSDLKFSNILKEDLSTSSVDLGKSSYSYYPGSRKKNRMSAIIANKSHDRDILNNSLKSAPLKIDHAKSDETMTMAFSSKNSAFVPCKTSILPKDKGSRINSGFRDVSLKMSAARSMLESSNRDTAPASDDARVPCQLSCNLHPMEQLLPRAENNFTRTAKEQCSQILQYAYAPEKWSSAVPSKKLIRKYVLNDDTCSLVKDEDRSANGVFRSLFHDKSCISAEAIAKPFETTETLGSKNMKRDESQYFQWRDVPRKITASCSLERKDHLAGSESINGNLRSPASDAGKCFTRSVQTVVSLKGNEISYASSSLSDPEVTQASIEIEKIDRNVRCTNNPVLDEGSRNDKSWSSVDAREKENCTELLDSVSHTGLIERGSLQAVRKEPFPNLFEELRLLDSLKPKHKEYRIHRNSTLQEGRDNLQTTELISKKRKKIGWMKPDSSFTVSGLSSVNSESPKSSEEAGQNAGSVWDMQRSVEWDEVSPRNCEGFVEESFKQRTSAFSANKDISLNRDLHRVHLRQLQTAEGQKIARFDRDNLAAPEIFRTKRLKVNSACASSEQIQHVRCNDFALAEKIISVDRLCSGSMNFFKWMARPTVSGKYGIISNGNLSKPVKVLPLRHILKKAVHHAERSNINLAFSHGNDKVKSTSAKITKKSVGNVKEISRDEKGLYGEVKASAILDVASIELKHHEPSGETETESCSASKGCNDLSCKSRTCKMNHFFTDNKGRDWLKTKFKEPRSRSIHELLIKGKGSTTRYQGELTDDPANDEVQTNEMNNAKRSLERPQHKKLNVLCCGCGGPNKDNYNQVLECKRCSTEGLLQSEDKAVDLDFCKRGMVHAPSLSLQAGENSFTCARTEGYKGRKWEGFWHNHVQESNGDAACLVPQEQLNAWLHIHRRKLHRKGRPKLPSSNVDSNCRKAYARYKQLKEWKHLVVYKSGIHALGLYTSQFISCGAMVVEYVGEIVGLRVADKREREYHSGKKLQHKSACYFFRIDKEHIIDATRKGGIARFVNHSCLPNCAAKVISVRNEKKVVFLAERDIYPGEEITYDYHFNHEDEGEKITCYCKSKNCRRYLN